METRWYTGYVDTVLEGLLDAERREAAETQSLFRLAFAAATLASYQAGDPAAKAKNFVNALPAMIGWIPIGKRGPRQDKTADEALYAEQQAHMADAVETLRRMALAARTIRAAFQDIKSPTTHHFRPRARTG